MDKKCIWGKKITDKTKIDLFGHLTRITFREVKVMFSKRKTAVPIVKHDGGCIMLRGFSSVSETGAIQAERTVSRFTFILCQ